MSEALFKCDREILFDEIVNALKGMPEDLEEIFILTHYEGRTPRELASRFHVPVSELTAKIRKANRAFFSNLRGKELFSAECVSH